MSLAMYPPQFRCHPIPVSSGVRACVCVCVFVRMCVLVLCSSDQVVILRCVSTATR